MKKSTTATIVAACLGLSFGLASAAPAKSGISSATVLVPQSLASPTEHGGGSGGIYANGGGSSCIGGGSGDITASAPPRVFSG